VKNSCRKNIPVTLVANKVDLEGKRVVSKKQGMEVAKDLGLEYIETSAYTNMNVSNTIVFSLRKILEMTKKGYILQQKGSGIEKRES